MGRIRLTQVFPCLLPLRKRQKKLFFYAKMRLDGNHYAEERSEQELPYAIIPHLWKTYLLQRIFSSPGCWPESPCRFS